jgi:AhpD family alkylhydroperoxidase
MIAKIHSMSTNRKPLSKTAREVYRAIDALDESVNFDEPLRELVRLRASQLNGCAWCVDQHSRDAHEGGDDPRRIHSVTAWREAPFFDSRERAALALTEAMTLLSANGVPDDVYAEAAREFSPEELGNLMGAIIAINAWNRVGVATGMQPPLELPTAVA